MKVQKRPNPAGELAADIERKPILLEGPDLPRVAVGCAVGYPGNMGNCMGPKTANSKTG